RRHEPELLPATFDRLERRRTEIAEAGHARLSAHPVAVRNLVAIEPHPGGLLSLPEVRIGGGWGPLNRAYGGPPREGRSASGARGVRRGGGQGGWAMVRMWCWMGDVC